jgi:hypothetical protein
MKHHLIRQAGVEDGVFDLADDRRDLRCPHRNGQFMIQTERDSDLKPPVGTLYDFQRMLFRRAGLVDLKLLLRESLKAPAVGHRVKQEILFGHTRRHGRRTHDIEGFSLAKLFLEVQIHPERQAGQFNQFCGKSFVNAFLEAIEGQPAPQDK